MFKLVIYNPTCRNNMKLYKRYFFYGSVITSLVWIMSIYLYSKLEDMPSHMGYYESKLKLKSKYSNSIKHNDAFDQLYGHNIESDNQDLAGDIIEIQRQQAKKMKHSGKHMNREDLDSVGSYGDEDLRVRLFEKKRKRKYNDKFKNEVLPPRGDDISELGVVRNAEDQKIKDQGDRLYAYNLLISDRLNLNRGIPDTRHADCKGRFFPTLLPSATIVICFHNEAFSALMRTVHTVIQRTPANLLHEIVLIDDFSSIENLKSNLENYIIKKNFTKVKLFRTERREGLIRARIMGAEKATGEVLVFLDSHCEVNTDWIQPLLVSIQEDPTTVTIPVIDIINSDSFNYEASPLVRGGFNWGMHFRWDNIPQSWWKKHRSPADPIP